MSGGLRGRHEKDDRWLGGRLTAIRTADHMVAGPRDHLERRTNQVLLGDDARPTAVTDLQVDSCDQRT